MSVWTRLLGIPDPVQVEPPEKAAVGPGVAFMTNDVFLPSLSRSPQRLMAEAQALYHANPWVRTAEDAVTRRVVGLPWHLEDGDNEVDDTSPERLRLVWTLLERPQLMLPGRRQMTRRELVTLTSRHMGLCGMGYWYLDQMDRLARTPLSIIYVNPARVWAASDVAGNLTGWVLDAKSSDGAGGLPLALDELLAFYLAPPDTGHYGAGLVEAAALKAQITALADRHAAYTLSTGGRLAGIVSPKEGTIPDENFQALVREFRNVTEAPDAAKRTTILQGPIEFTPTAASPLDLSLLDISKMNRDDILAVWGVPPTQAAIPAPGGLNSGESRKYDEAVLMQGAVHDRVVSITETIQYGLLDRFGKLGISLEYEIVEPTFDDRAPAFELASKSVNVPMRTHERRALIGLDPLGTPEDDQIVMPATMVPMMAPMMPMKARTFVGLRASAERMLPATREAVHRVLVAQVAAVAAKLRERANAVSRQPKNVGTWWEDRQEDERLLGALRGHVASLAEMVTKRASGLLEGRTAKAGPTAEDILAVALRKLGLRITGINTTTRDALREFIVAGLADGLSPAQVADSMEAATPGAAWDPEYRAELIARTEMMTAYNTAALDTYREFGLEMVQAIDGDGDPECAARDGQVFSVDEAADIEDHPNGTLDWVPYFGEGKARESLTWQAPAITVPAPIVNVTPDIHVDTRAFESALDTARERAEARREKAEAETVAAREAESTAKAKAQADAEAVTQAELAAMRQAMTDLQASMTTQMAQMQLAMTRKPEPPTITYENGVAVAVNGRPVKRDASGRLVGLE